MSSHKIGDREVWIHNVQNVLLISDGNGPITDLNKVRSIIKEVVANKKTYNIQDDTLPFDVYVRSGNILMQYSFNEKGEDITESPVRNLDEEGLFHFQFAPLDKDEAALSHFQFASLDKDEAGLSHSQFASLDKPVGTFQIKDEKCTISRLTIDKFKEFSHEEKKALIYEIAKFNQIHFNEHFELWKLDSNIESEQVIEHFHQLILSLSDLYLIRNEKKELISINGISATKDKNLTYQSLTITHIDYRKKGCMALNLFIATINYPNAVMTAYFVNQEIRNHLGKEAMTKRNEPNLISSELHNNYLKQLFTNRGEQNDKVSIKEQLQSIKEEIDIHHELPVKIKT